MKQSRKVACLAILAVATVEGCAVRTKTTLGKSDEARSFPPHAHRVCLLAGGLPDDFKTVTIGTINATKRAYGGTDRLMAPIAQAARAVGADAVINLQADQRVKGPLPWRIVAPTGDGTAIKILDGSPKLDCEAAGGQLY